MRSRKGILITKSFMVALGVLSITLGPAGCALADTASSPPAPCTVKSALTKACATFFGGALNLGDPAVTDSIIGKSAGAAVNYSLAGDGTIWNVNFSYTPADPVRDNGVGFLIYDGTGHVVINQTANGGNPPSTIQFPLATTGGVTYQVQVFDYIPGKIQYTLGVTQGS